MKYIVTINNKNYEVEVERGQATLLKTTQGPSHTPQSLPVQPSPAALPATAISQSTQQAATTANISGEAIKSPMPGTILDVKVAAGTTVKSGDILIILEAMKMENEIMAPRDGVISQILASKGASVSTGDVLITMN